MAIVHQSDLAAWNRCPAQLGYTLESRRSDQNSASAFGTVMHHAMHVLERYGDLDKAIETFLYYWHPLNIDQLTEPVPRDGWIGKQTYGSLRIRGVDTLRKYADLIKYDDHQLLGLEYDFVVPLEGTPHHLAGTVDRLVLRWFRRQQTVGIDDFKTGQQKWNLRHNVQGTAYAYATTRPEFWTGNTVEGTRLGRTESIVYEADGFGEERGRELHERFADAPRRFVWINLQRFRFVDGGYRGPIDYERLKLSVSQVAASVDAEIFPLRIDGETCSFCAFRGTCGGTGLPDDEHGRKVRI